MNLVRPEHVIDHLARAGAELSAAHQDAVEQEGDRRDLNGPVRDIIFGINTAVSALVLMIEESRPKRHG